MKKFRTLGYYNGKFDEISDVLVPLSDRAFYFGDGVYDASACVNKVIFALDEHIDRFFRSAEGIKITLPFSKTFLKEELYKMVDLMNGKDFFVYWQASRGSAPRKHVFPDVKPNLAIMINPYKLPDLEKKLNLITFEDLRFEYCNYKTLNLIPSVLASQKAKEENADEAVFYRKDGFVTECAHSNILIIKDRTVISHPLDNLILPGISQAHILKQAKKLGIKTEERAFSVAELFEAAEIIVSNSGNFIQSVSSIDKKAVGGKNPVLFKQIQNAVFAELYETTKERL